MGGYSAAKKEFESTLRKITQLGYGVVLIAHSATRIEKGADGSDIEIISPELPKRAYEVCNGIVDIIGYIGSEWVNGEQKRWLYTRETPTLFAGSRFKYLDPKIPFSYQGLVDAIGEAIDKAQKLDGATIVEHTVQKKVEVLDYQAIRAEAETLWKQLLEKGNTEEEKQDIARAISKKIEMVFGRTMKLSEITEDQVDLFNLVVLDMRDML